MNPEEKEMLARAVKLSEENSRVLLHIQKRIHWFTVWGFVKVFVIAIPLIISYFYLQPYFGSVGQSLTDLKQIIGQY